MKEIKKTVESFVTVFVANDGTEFEDRTECQRYDNSAKGVLMAKYRPLVVKETDGYSVGCGSEDVAIDIIKIKKDADINIVLQLETLDHQPNDERTERINTILQRALREDDYVIVDRGCCGDESFWVLDSLNGKLEQIRKACEPKTEE